MIYIIRDGLKYNKSSPWRGGKLGLATLIGSGGQNCSGRQRLLNIKRAKRVCNEKRASGDQWVN